MYKKHANEQQRIGPTEQKLRTAWRNLRAGIETARENPASRVNIGLWTYTFSVMWLTFASWVIYVTHHWHSYLRPLFDQADQFRDLTNYIGKTANLLGGAAYLGRGIPIYTYPAPAAFVYKALIYAFPGHAVRTYLCFLAICILSFSFVAWRASRQATKRVQYSVAAAIFITSLFGFPLIFTADRGKIERPAAFVYKALIYVFTGHAVRTYLCFLAICILSFTFVAWRGSQATKRVQDSVAAAIFITCLFGYPLIFTADRGNIEVVVWALAAAGLCFLLRARYGTAAVLIGLAASIKPFSSLFMLLLISRQKYKETAIGVGIAGLVTLASLTALGPNPWKAFQDLRPGVSLYMARYINNLTPYDEERFEHSLLDGMKSTALAVEMGGIHPRRAAGELEKLSAEPGGWHVVHTLVHIYPVVAITAFGLLIALFYKMPILNQLTALGVAVTLFPAGTRDYTLLHLYVPFGALVVFLAREVAAGKTTFRYAPILAFGGIYGLLFAPLTFLQLYASDAKLLLLLALLFVAARWPMHSVYFDDLTTDRTQRPLISTRRFLSP